jgi:hypothetical protein
MTEDASSHFMFGAAMRTLLVVATVLFAVGATTPALAAMPSRSAIAATDAVLAVPQADPLAGLSEIRKKKKEAATLQTVSGAKRGKKGLKIKIKVAKADHTCKMTLQWADGSSAEVDDVDASSGKVCTFVVNVPNKRGAIGEAEVSVRVTDATGKKVASVEGSFKVR